MGGIELAAEVEGQQEPDDREPAEHVAQRQLQKPHAGRPEALAWHTEHRGGTRFGGHDRPQNHPPGQVAVAQEVGVERADATCGKQPDGDGRPEVDHQDGDIDGAKRDGHRCVLEFAAAGREPQPDRWAESSRPTADLPTAAAAASHFRRVRDMVEESCREPSDP